MLPPSAAAEKRAAQLIAEATAQLTREAQQSRPPTPKRPAPPAPSDVTETVLAAVVDSILLPLHGSDTPIKLRGPDGLLARASHRVGCDLTSRLEDLRRLAHASNSQFLSSVDVSKGGDSRPAAALSQPEAPAEEVTGEVDADASDSSHGSTMFSHEKAPSEIAETPFSRRLPPPPGDSSGHVVAALAAALRALQVELSATHSHLGAALACLAESQAALRRSDERCRRMEAALAVETAHTHHLLRDA